MNVARVLAMAVLGTTLLGGCALHPPSPDYVETYLCDKMVCSKPGPLARVLTPRFAADADDVIVPFLCAPPGQTNEELRAMVFTVSSGAWRKGAIARQAVSDELDPAPLPPHKVTLESLRLGEEKHAYSADGKRAVWTARVDPADPVYHYELFFSENGTTKQLTHFNVPGAPLRRPRLSADGSRAVAKFNGEMAVVDTSTGATTVVPIIDRTFADCAAT